MNQLSFNSYRDNVAEFFNSDQITNICRLIDQKQDKGLKCTDLKQWLLGLVATSVDLTIPTNKMYKEVYEFIKKDIDN